MKNIPFYLYVLFLIVSCNAQQEQPVNYQQELTEIIEVNHVHKSDITITIDKSDYTLCLSADTLILKEYPVVFGNNPVDDKFKQGDKCTPEGTFNMRAKYPHKNWSKFIWINYPNADTWKKHNAAKKEGKIPKNANIGGEIGIHGVPKGMDNLIDLKFNWTLGCISMKNKDVNEIYPYVSETTLIIIKK